MSAHSIFPVWVSYGLLAGLAIALAVAALTDIRRRQIDNGLNAAIALAAPAFWWSTGLTLSQVGAQLLAATLCLLVLWALFALRLMGGGDVKLLAALALWIRPEWFVKLLVLMAMLGGAISVVLATWHFLRKRREPMSVPYGVAISGAALFVLARDYVPLLNSAAAG